MKLTRIFYDSRMIANKETGVVEFWSLNPLARGGIQLIHLSADSPDVEIDENRLPDGAIHITCGQLKARSRTLENKTSAQEFEAKHRVTVRTQKFYAQADVVTYDESKDLLILKAERGNVVRFWQQKQAGGSREPTRAEKVWYIPSKDSVRLDGTETIGINR
jgi:hypothetical protein